METSELYLNGLSTSLPPDVQRRFLARVPGLEQARMTQPGYAMEYDYYSPKRLEATPSLKLLNGLYLAGRVNGTTGYEEAAQVDFVGLVASDAALGEAGFEPDVLTLAERELKKREVRSGRLDGC